MTPDLATFRIVYPEFATVSDQRVQYYLDDAAANLLVDAWGPCYANAVLSYAAHELALSQARLAAMTVSDEGDVSIAPTGNITNASAEGLTVGFAAPRPGSSDADLYWSQTPYGQRYLALARQCLSRGSLSW